MGWGEKRESDTEQPEHLLLKLCSTRVPALDVLVSLPALPLSIRKLCDMALDLEFKN
jgi:hypothetical protein